MAEVSIRRAVSAMYYSLFHRLTVEGAKTFSGGGEALIRQAARAYNHGTMRDVCTKFVKSPLRPFSPQLDHLMPVAPDARLIAVADAFVRLQEARHTADYDLAATFTRQYGLDLLTVAEFAHWKLDEIEHLPDTRVFLTALLLADRWTRRG